MSFTIPNIHKCCLGQYSLVYSHSASRMSYNKPSRLDHSMLEEIVNHPLCCCRQWSNQYCMEGKCIFSKEEGVYSGYGMLGPATLYFMLCANLSHPKMHPPRIYSSLVFGSAAGGAGQAAAINMTSHGSIFSGVKVVVSNNNGYLRPLFVPFTCACGLQTKKCISGGGPGRKARLGPPTVGRSLRPTVLTKPTLMTQT
jgi:hypothetical protein